MSSTTAFLFASSFAINGEPGLGFGVNLQPFNPMYSSQQWQVNENQDGTVSILNPDTGLYLSAPFQNGPVVMGVPGDSYNSWKIVPSSSGVSIFSSAQGDGKTWLLSVMNGAGVAGASILLINVQDPSTLFMEYPG